MFAKPKLVIDSDEEDEEPEDQEYHVTKNEHSQVEILKFLRNQVYPDLDTAIQQLVKHLQTTNEVQQHSEKLQHQKFYDLKEKDRIEKARLKKEYGDEYESSLEDYEDVGESDDDDSADTETKEIKR